MKELKGTLIWLIGFLGGGLSLLLLQNDYILFCFVASGVSGFLGATISLLGGKE